MTFWLGVTEKLTLSLWWRDVSFKFGTAGSLRWNDWVGVFVLVEELLSRTDELFSFMAVSNVLVFVKLLTDLERLLSEEVPSVYPALGHSQSLSV